MLSTMVTIVGGYKRSIMRSKVKVKVDKNERCELREYHGMIKAWLANENKQFKWNTTNKSE